jgi:hypothetical protein
VKGTAPILRRHPSDYDIPSLEPYTLRWHGRVPISQSPLIRDRSKITPDHTFPHADAPGLTSELPPRDFPTCPPSCAAHRWTMNCFPRALRPQANAPMSPRTPHIPTKSLRLGYRGVYSFDPADASAQKAQRARPHIAYYVHGDIEDACFAMYIGP